MPAPEIIHQLVAKFEENREAYRSGKYNEARLRQEFLDHFFIALGWDVYNEKGVAPEYADVVIEDSFDIEGTSKAPDYAFKIGRERKFFVEAKKPRVDIQYDIHPAFQLRRYAWNAHLPLSILTDFEEFAVYNCKSRPNPSDSAATSRDIFFRYTDYIEKWDEIAAIFSRDAVWKGGLDRYADTSKGKKGTTEVDDEFLKDMNEWRIKLARNIALRNPHVADEQQLNYAVQMTIDRVIFLRICEDRGIETEEQLKTLSSQPGVYARLLELFRRADLRYNSGLFNFTHDKDDNTPPDTFTPALAIDDRVLKEIIHGLYYPCPYIFKEIPVEILGQVYEQFLGQVIRLTPGHQAKVEEKPEVRKAGGVYYTPRYIVDYIVANTVGKLLEGKTPEQAAALKIVDPACGSGSFLLGAFRCLIDWHEQWYLANDPSRWTKGKAPALNEVTNGYRLTTLKKKEILLNNIHGVDIDPQAVEVTKLSLLLKVLEEESGQLSLGLERTLPDLGKNIQCGNSLIGEDYFAGQLVVDPAERRRVNPFEWDRAFPQVFKQGGFDAVIGNPPYLIAAAKTDFDYYNKHYQLTEYQTDYYVYFIERATYIGKNNGFLSFIISDAWLNSEYFSKIRNSLLLEHRINEIVIFDYPVFHDANMENSIINVSLFGKPQTFKIERFVNPSIHESATVIDPNEAFNQGLISPNLSSEKIALLNMIEKNKSPIGMIFNINRGLHAYRTDGYGISKFGKGFQTKRDKVEKSYHSNIPINSTYLPELKGKDVHRFYFTPTGIYLSYGDWLAEPRERKYFYSSKVVLRKILGPKLHGTFIKEPTAIDQSLYIIIHENEDERALIFILGLMLSRLTAWYLRTKYAIYDTLFPWYTVKQLKAFPIIDFNEDIYSLTIRILDLHKQTPATPQEQDQLRREIESTDRQIDQLVYQLYGLTPEEIKIVEGSF